MSMLLKLQIVHIHTTHHKAANERFSTLKRTKTDDTQPKLNVVCFVVQSCLTDADFVIFSNYCLIGTRETPPLIYRQPHGNCLWLNHLFIFQLCIQLMNGFAQNRMTHKTCDFV